MKQNSLITDYGKMISLPCSFQLPCLKQIALSLCFSLTKFKTIALLSDLWLPIQNEQQFTGLTCN